MTHLILYQIFNRPNGATRDVPMRRTDTSVYAQTRERLQGICWRDLKNRASRRRGREITSTLPSRSGTDGKHRTPHSACFAARAFALGGYKQAWRHWMGVAVARTRRSGTDNDRGTPTNPRRDNKRTTAWWGGRQNGWLWADREKGMAILSSRPNRGETLLLRRFRCWWSCRDG